MADATLITLYYDDTSREVQADDSSYRYRALMEKPQLVLKFSLPEYIEFPVGTYCEYQNETYKVYNPQDIVKNGTRDIEYTLTMGTEEELTGLIKFRNYVDGRLKWSLCATPAEFAEYICEAMNANGNAGTWEVGDCIEATEQTVEFNHAYVDEALQDVADTFETEWEIVSTTDADTGVTTHTVRICKVEYFEDSPLALSYGKGNGFIPGLGRSCESDEMPIKRLYVQGGEDNIDRSEYGAQYLLLPKGQSIQYEGREYTSDNDGLYIERTGTVDDDGNVEEYTSDAIKEDSLDCSEIYPSYLHTVTEVECEDEDNNFYNVYDTNTPSDLDYDECLIDGETMTIIFQSGMLAGREFDVSYSHSTRKFEIVPAEMDGLTMPGDVYLPEVGDTFRVFGVMLPDAYICDNDSQTGASWEMMEEAARHLYENEDQKFTFSGTLQALWARRNWTNIGGYMKVGAYIRFTDTQFAPDGTDIRIVGIKDYVNTPYSPTIEISNSVTGSSLVSQLREIAAQEVLIEDTRKDIVSYVRRRFRDAQETLEMLQDSLLDYSSAINPITVSTMALLVGDESLQFRFVEVDDDGAVSVVTHNITYDADTKQLTCPGGTIQHMTLGIDSISSEHSTDEYLFWDVADYTSAVLDDGDTAYYLYIKVNKTDTDEEGEFLLSEDAIALEGVSGYYHLLVGILNSEADDTRSFVTLYGYTEILPGRITTDKIVSGDGESYFDMANDAMKLGDVLAFNVEGGGELVLNNGTFSLDADGSIHAGDDDSYLEYDAGDSTLSITGALNAAGGTIGSFTVNSNGWLSADNDNDEGGSYGMDISAAVLQVSSTDMAVGSTTFNVTARMQAYASVTTSYHYAAYLSSDVEGASYYNYAVYAAATGDNKANYGLYVAAGLTKLQGVENNVLVISSTTTVYLDDEGSDSINTILFSAKGSTTVYLPASPNSGRTILVINYSGYSLVLNANGMSLYNLKGSSSGTTYTSANQEMTWLVYYNTYWYVAHSDN